jgi:hypothetical protein
MKRKTMYFDLGTHSCKAWTFFRAKDPAVEKKKKMKAGHVLRCHL